MASLIHAFEASNLTLLTWGYIYLDLGMGEDSAGGTAGGLQSGLQ